MAYPAVGMEVIPLESAIVGRIVRRLDKEPRCWHFKTHGSAYARRGVPDIIGCLHGRMFALEVKRPKVGEVSPSQKVELRKLANAGALSAVVDSLESACLVLGIDVKC